MTGAACSFCLLAGTGNLIANADGSVRICEECVGLCAEIVKEAAAERKRTFSYGIRVDEAIESMTIDMIDAGGTLFRSLSRDEAIKRAKDAGLALVQINPGANPPVCKIMKWPRPR